MHNTLATHDASSIVSFAGRGVSSEVNNIMLADDQPHVTP